MMKSSRYGHFTIRSSTTTFIATTLVTIVLANLHKVKAEFILEIELNHYLSTAHTRADGFCCKSLDYYPCTIECNNRFLFCLLGQPRNQSVMDTTLCSFGNYTTNNISRDNDTFIVGEYLDEGVPNPMVFRGSSWPGFVMLYVRVDHMEPTASQSSGIQNSLVAQFDIWINISLEENRTVLIRRSTPYRDRNFSGKSLYLTIELSCGERFYGPDCTKWCEPRDDVRGHYICDNGGNIICLEGFQNEVSNCTECLLSNTCSLIGGYCNDTHSCVCHEGFIGDDCEIDLDPCGHLLPCENGGICVNNVTFPGEYTCSCLRGYGGDKCELDLDSCSHLEPCLNGASCVNKNPNAYKCTCTAGFKGRNCSQETKECSPNICQNSGTCVDLHLDFMCTCAPGFSGKHCETDINECLSIPCLNGGSCQDNIGGYQCHCVEGFIGRNCNDNPSAVGFAAIVGGGGVGCLLLVLIILVLVVILIWVFKQLRKEKTIVAEGDLRGKEEQLQREMLTLSADNPTFHEHEATQVGVMEQTTDQSKFANPPYEGVLGQYYSEQNNPLSNGGYSRLIHTKMGGSQQQPQLRFAETMAYPHYSSLDLNTANNVTPLSSHVSPKCEANPKCHQYEDIDQDSSELRLKVHVTNWHKNAESITNSCCDDVSVARNGGTQRTAQAINNVSTELIESNRLQVETQREVEKDECINEAEFMIVDK